MKKVGFAPIAAGAVVALAAIASGTVWFLASPQKASKGKETSGAPPSAAQGEEALPASSPDDANDVSGAALQAPTGDVFPEATLPALAAIALDQSAPAEERKAAVSALRKRDGVEAVDTLLTVARSAFGTDQTSPIAHQLAQEIASLSTPEAVERMGLVLTDNNPDFPEFADLPVALQDAVQSSLRKNPDAELVAKFLIGEHSSEIPDLARSRIQMLEHPETTARLAQIAFQQGNNPLFQERMAMLETTRDPRVYDSSVRLARNGIITSSDVQTLVYNWASNDPQLVDAGRAVADMQSSERPVADRSIAAYALAGYAAAAPSSRGDIMEAFDKVIAEARVDASLRENILRARQMLSER
jgi:hypothetical protein